jgi:NAD(P)-dependent dehydrogenase (short-subunit alcohol dehydrogenase family)
MSKIILILGAGPRVGQATAATFASAGYKVALASRSAAAGISLNGHLGIAVDFSNPATIKSVFDKVEKQWGAPSVVVYNGNNLRLPIATRRPLTVSCATAAAFTSAPEGPLTVSLDAFTSDLNVNTISAYMAASEAFARNSRVAFLYTGNILNVRPSRNFVTLGVGKAASAQWIETAATAHGATTGAR